MATIPDCKINVIKQLYTAEKMSAREIAEKLNFSLNAVYYTLRKHQVQRRSLKESAAASFANKPLSFTIKKKLTADDEKLLISGALLYWAEGYKTDKSPGIDFANSDVAMQKLFIKFLRVICGIDESRLRILLYTHSNKNKKNQMKFWSTQLAIPLTQFTNPYISPLGRLEKNDKMPYGLVHVRYYDKKLLRQVIVWIEQIKNQI